MTELISNPKYTIDDLKKEKSFLPNVSYLEKFDGIEETSEDLPKALRRQDGELKRAKYILAHSESVKKMLEELLQENEYAYLIEQQNEDDLLALLENLIGMNAIEAFANFYFGTGAITPAEEQGTPPESGTVLHQIVRGIDREIDSAVRGLTGDM